MTNLQIDSHEGKVCLTHRVVFFLKKRRLCPAETHAALSAREERDRVSASETHSTGSGGLRVPEGDWPRSFRRGKYIILILTNNTNTAFKE